MSREHDVVGRIEKMNKEMKDLQVDKPDPSGCTPGFQLTGLSFEYVKDLRSFQLEYAQCLHDRQIENMRREAAGQIQELKSCGIVPEQRYSSEEYINRFMHMISVARLTFEARMTPEAVTLVHDIIRLSEIGSDGSDIVPVRSIYLWLRAQALFAAGDILAQEELFFDALKALNELRRHAESHTPDAVPVITKELARRHFGFAASGLDREANLRACRTYLSELEAGGGLDAEEWKMYVRTLAALQEYKLALDAVPKLTAAVQAENATIEGSFRRELVAISYMSRFNEPERFRKHFGPFSAPILAECAGISLSEAWAAVGNEKGELLAPKCEDELSAVLIGNVAVIEEGEDVTGGLVQAEIIMHEMMHVAAARGTTYKTEGEWHYAGRDIPTAALMTYLGHIARAEEGGHPISPSLAWLVNFGLRAAKGEPDACDRYISNMLEYFVAVGLETNSAYQCAAIHAGVLVETLGPAGSEEVQSYIWHLTMLSHEAAMDKARRRVHVEL